MKVTIIKDYFDLEKKRTVSTGETLDVPDKRGKVLIEKGVGKKATGKTPPDEKGAGANDADPGAGADSSPADD